MPPYRTAKTVAYQYNKNPKGDGNIDLRKRPMHRNEDGSVSTVRSMSFRDKDGKETLIPTIAREKNGKSKKMTNDEAINHYHKTGEYLGKYNSVKEANRAAQNIHRDQELYYSGPKKIMDTVMKYKMPRKKK